MRATVTDSGVFPSAATTTSISFRRGFSAKSLRRHQVASLEPSSEEELHLLDLLHSRLSDSLQSLLLPSPDSKTLTLSFLHKLLDCLLACESDFKSLLLLVHSRNPSLLSRPQIDRAVLDLLDRAVKSMDLCNAVSLSIHHLRIWNLNADIAASALSNTRASIFTLPQIGRAERALSKLLSLKSSSRFMGPNYSMKRSIHSGSESGSAAILAQTIHAMSALLHSSMWAMAGSFPSSGGEMHPPPQISAGAARQMPWAAAMAQIQERIGDEMRKEGRLAEAVVLERRGREVMEMAENREGGLKVAAAELGIASRKLAEGLGAFEKKVREVFRCLVSCREEVIRCLGDRGGSSASSPPMDSLALKNISMLLIPNHGSIELTLTLSQCKGLSFDLGIWPTFVCSSERGSIWA